MSTPGPFAGLRVLDLGQYLAGPLVAMLLADGGADVIHVDPPGGPRWHHPANVALQRGKRRVELDLHAPADRAVARDLALGADVLIEGFRPGVLARLGLDPHELVARNPGLICCSLPGFGSDDERAGLAGWELIVSAAGGLYRSGSWFSPSEDPVYSVVPLASGFAALTAAHAVVVALLARRRDGRGQRIEVPLFDSLFNLYGHFATGPVGAPPAGPPATANMAWIDRFRCLDGRYVDVSPPFRGLAAFGERWFPPAAVEAGYADPFNTSPEAAAAVKELLTALFAARPAEEWERLASAVGTGIAVCQTAAEWLDDEHARSSGCVVAVDGPRLGPDAGSDAGSDVGSDVGPVWQAGHLVQLGSTPFVARAGSGPADPAAIGWLAPSVAPALTDRADDRPPLAGVSMVDLTQVLAGPTAGRVLAGYGADVVKINDPRGANPTAFSGHPYVNAGKRSTLVDLRDPAGLELLYGLTATADVVHQNFARGAADRLGFGEARLRQFRPDLVFSSINTHADGGWRRDHRGHEELGQAVTGMQTRLGGDGIPIRASWTVCDYATGHASAFGILTALYHRACTGEGQRVGASLSASATVLQLPFLVATPGRVWDEPAGQEALGWGPARRLYRAADGWLAVMAGDAAEVERVLGGEAAESIEAVPAAASVARLMAAGVAAHVYTTMAEVLDHPSTAARRLAVVANGERTVVAAPRLSRTPVVALGPAPAAGEHSLTVAAAVLGRAAADTLARRGVVAGA